LNIVRGSDKINVGLNMEVPMKMLGKFVLIFSLAALFTGTCPLHSQARTDVFIGGSVGFAPYYWYDPWYDPWYGPGYHPYYYPSNFGYLRTNVEPDKAEVWVDDKYFGITDDFDGWFYNLKLPLGVHKVQFRLKGYRTYTVNFTVTPDDTTTIDRKLEPLAEGEVDQGDYGSLVIRPSQPGTDIYIDGQKYPSSGKTEETINLLSGRHEIRITKEGYTDFVATALIAPGSTVNLDAELKEKAGE
jgi:hypothetical protein